LNKITNQCIVPEDGLLE